MRCISLLPTGFISGESEWPGNLARLFRLNDQPIRGALSLVRENYATYVHRDRWCRSVDSTDLKCATCVRAMFRRQKGIQGGEGVASSRLHRKCRGFEPVIAHYLLTIHSVSSVAG